MGKTLIEWAHYTFNLWEGCWKISPACEHCYAEAMNKWLRQGKHWGRTAPRRFFKHEDKHFAQLMDWNRKAIREGTRFRVFVESIGDFGEIHPEVAINAEMNRLRKKFWSYARLCPNLDFLMLTKRPENYPLVLPWMNAAMRTGTLASNDAWPNVWLGVTGEDHLHACIRLKAMSELVTPAVSYLSYEPALGEIDWDVIATVFGMPDWIIFGDESGRKKRPAELVWAEKTRDACIKYGSKFLFKQWNGADVAGIAGDRDAKKKIHLPILDGRQWAEFPNGGS